MSRCMFLFFALISSWAFVGHCQGLPGGDSLPCIQKLMPCQPYLKGSPSPPASCCAPLKEVVTGDSECLCAVFNDEDILKSLNITQDDGLNLVKSCGASADTSICKKATTPSGSSSTPAAPSKNSSTTAESPKSGAAAISRVGVYLSLATILSLLINSV